MTDEIDVTTIQQKIERTFIVAIDPGQTELGLAAGFADRPTVLKTLMADDVLNMIRNLTTELFRLINDAFEMRDDDLPEIIVVFAAEGAYLNLPKGGKPNPRMYCELCQILGAMQAASHLLDVRYGYIFTTAQIDKLCDFSTDRKRAAAEDAWRRYGIRPATQHVCDAMATFTAARAQFEIDLLQKAAERNDDES